MSAGKIGVALPCLPLSLPLRASTSSAGSGQALSHQGRGETQPRGQDAHAPRHAPCVTSLINFNRIAGFQWDQGTTRKSADKHGVTQAEAEQVFVNNTFILSGDIEHSQSEPRFHALGVTDAGRRLHITFTLREEDTLIRVISARDMKHRERLRYEQET